MNKKEFLKSLGILFGGLFIPTSLFGKTDNPSKALTGIKNKQYWDAGYSKAKNIVIEYYEMAHEKKKERDDRRQKEIEEFLGCEFIIIKEEK